MLAAHQVVHPNFEETLYFLPSRTVSMKKLIRVHHSHTNVSLGDDQEMVFAGRLSILENYEWVILRLTTVSLIDFSVFGVLLTSYTTLNLVLAGSSQQWQNLHESEVRGGILAHSFSKDVDDLKKDWMLNNRVTIPKKLVVYLKNLQR